MASLFGHTAAALTAGRLLPAAPKPLRFWLLTALVSFLPDFDVIAFFFGIPYHSQWGHRGFTHSFAFAAALGPLAAALAWPGLKLLSARGAALSAYFALVTASHSVLDAFTNGGLGVAFYWPFDDRRYFLSYRFIEVSPIGVGAFFSEQGLAVIKSELLFIGLPCLVLIACNEIIRRLRR